MLDGIFKMSGGRFKMFGGTSLSATTATSAASATSWEDPQVQSWPGGGMETKIYSSEPKICSSTFNWVWQGLGHPGIGTHRKQI